MIQVNCDYNIKDDIEFFLEAKGINNLELSENIHVSRSTLDEVLKKGHARKEVYEKFYSYAYKENYRLNSVKEELLKEKFKNILFHGSKNGLSFVDDNGSRDKCDFGRGFYLGETYNQALSFVCEKEDSSVYSFKYCLDELKVERFECDLEWMLAICFYRGTIGEYVSNEKVAKIASRVKNADVVIAPIADNKMFYIMSQFADGDINADVALHSLSASKLGLQYIFKTSNAVNSLVPMGRYYLCGLEKETCKKALIERSYEVDTKLKLAKREFKTGLYIEEILK